MNINALLIITSDNRLIMKYSLDAIISFHLVRTGDGSSWEKYFRRRTMTRRTKGSLLPRLFWPA